MTSVRAYDISEQMYVVREEQIVENVTLGPQIIHNQKIETERQ